MRRPILASLSLLAISFSFIVSVLPLRAATLTIINADAPGVGFNDPTQTAPVGGNGGTTIGQQRLNAAQYAADIWGSVLESSVEIRVAFSFSPQECDGFSGVLAAAGPSTFFRDFPGAPLAGTFYPVALANKLSGLDLCPPAGSCFTEADIEAVFNGNLGTPGCLGGFSWYYGLDASPPSGNAFDVVTIAIHEIGHGLGFVSTVDDETGRLLLPRGDVFSSYLEDHDTGLLFSEMSSAERAAAIVSSGDLHWVGPEAVDASGALDMGVHLSSGHVEMHAPSQVEPGSSTSHFSDTLSPDDLMEPNYTQANHDVGLSEEVFRDIGWATEGVPATPVPVPVPGPQTSTQQGCINAMNKNGAKVAAAQGKVNRSCITDAGRGKVVDVQACLAADGKGQVAKKAAKTVADEAKKCTEEVPDFGYFGASVVNSVAGEESVRLVADVFGANLAAAIATNVEDAKCQATVSKRYEKVAATQLKEFVACKKSALRSGADRPSILESCVTPGGIDADAKGKVGKTVAKLGDDIAKRCNTNLFAGACQAEALGDLAACIEERVRCRVCRMINSMDGLSVECDDFDDDVANGSCTAPVVTAELAL